MELSLVRGSFARADLAGPAGESAVCSHVVLSIGSVHPGDLLEELYSQRHLGRVIASIAEERLHRAREAAACEDLARKRAGHTARAQDGLALPARGVTSRGLRERPFTQYKLA